MKKDLIIGMLTFISLFISLLSISQPQYSTGFTTLTANTIPFNTTTNQRQWIFYPSNFTGAPAGVINKIYIKASASVSCNFTNFQVKMGNTTLSSFTAGPWYTTNMVTVFYSASFSVSSITGNWIPITLQTPFAYNATSNFVVECSQQGYSPGFSVMQMTSGVTARSLFGSSSSTTASTQDRLADFGFDLATNTYDAGISSIVSPASPYCTALKNVVVNLTNYGSNTLTSDTIRWTINGIVQTPYPWTGSLAYGNSATVTIGNCTLSSTTPTTIKVYHSRINGTNQDNTKSNDTALKSNILITPTPVPGFTVNDTFQCLNNNSFVFTNTSTVSSGTFTSLWKFGDAITSSLTSPSHTYASIDTFPVKLIVTASPGGCKDSIIKNVATKPIPTSSFTINDSSQCFRGNAYAFSNNSTGNIINSWDFGDSTFSSTSNPASKTYLFTGTKTVRLAVTNTYGCTDTVRKFVYVRPHPVSNFQITTPTLQCLGGNLFAFQNSSGIPSGTFTNLWKFGDSYTSTLTSPTHHYADTGSYSVKLISTSNYGCNDSTAKVARVNPGPVAGFSPSDTARCITGNSFTFTNTTIVRSGTYTSLWRFGDGNTSTQNSPNYSYNSPGNYTVKLIATQAGCIDSIATTIHVGSRASVSYTVNDSDQCLSGNSFAFTNTSSTINGTLSYHWNFGDNTSSSTINPVKSYTQTGTYNIRLFANSNYGCRDSLAYNSVYIRPHPVSGFTINDSAQCTSNNSFDFSNTSTGFTSSFWNLGDSTFSTQSSPTAKNFLYPGTKTVKLVVTNTYGCKDSITHPVYALAHPKTAFTINASSMCFRGQSFRYTNASSGQISNFWDLGDTTFSTQVSPAVKKYLYIGSKTVKLVTENSYGCKDSIIRNVYVRPHPVSSFTVNNSSQCLRGNNFIFTNQSTGQTSSLWSFGDTATNPQPIKYLGTGPKTIKLTTTNTYGCKDTFSTILNVWSNPAASFSIVNQSQCLKGNSFTFSNSSTGYSGSNWYFGDSTNSSLDVPAPKTYLFSGNKTIKLVVVTVNGCKDSITQYLEVKPHPKGDFRVNKETQCFKYQSFVFTNMITGQTSNRWDLGDTTTSTLHTPPAKTYTYTGTKTIRLITNNVHNCPDTIIKTIKLSPHPISNFTVNDTLQCQRTNAFIFTNNSSGHTASEWLYSDTTSSNLLTPVPKHFVYSGPKFVVMVAKNDDNCTDTSYSQLRIKPSPMINLGRDTILYDSQSITLNAGIGYDSYLWSNSAVTPSITIDTLGIGQGSRTFWVKAMLGDCDGYDTIQITFVKFKSIASSYADIWMAIYPNPVHNEAVFEISALPSDVVLTLTDAQGRVLKKWILNQSANRQRLLIDLNNYYPGMYFLQITDGKYKEVVKLLKN